MVNTQRFDELCADYMEKQAELAEVKEQVDQAKASLMDMVQAHGIVPAAASASRRIEGSDYVATVTAGTTVEILDATVTELELVLSAAKLSDVFKQCFTRRVEYSLIKNADKVMEQAPVPKTLRTRIHTLYAKCFTVKGKTPSLKVEPLKVAPAKKGGR